MRGLPTATRRWRGRAGRAGGHLQPAVVHDQLARAALGDRGIVGDDQKSSARAAHLAERVEHGGGRFGIQAARGLVGEDQARPVDERAGDRHALRLAQRQQVRAGVRARGQAEPAQERVGALPRLRDGGRSRARPGSAMFSRAVSAGEEVALLEHEAEADAPEAPTVRRPRAPPGLVPSIQTCPSSGRSSVPSMWRSVVLPQPLAPIRLTLSPAPIDSDTWSTTVRSP